MSPLELAVALSLADDERRETSYVTSGGDNSKLPHTVRFAITHDELRQRVLSVEVLRTTSGASRRLGFAQMPLHDLGECRLLKSLKRRLAGAFDHLHVDIELEPAAEGDAYAQLLANVHFLSSAERLSFTVIELSHFCSAAVDELNAGGGGSSRQSLE